ncbi:MAG TPA: hypothetical protein VLV86_07550 [Vicinamibacterales bacterium]|nr:hypothetical protein [Vicinamibacterales bacterium]
MSDVFHGCTVTDARRERKTAKEVHVKRSLVQTVTVLGTVLGITGLCVVLGGRSVKADDDDHGGYEAKVRIGFDIAPVPLNLKNKDIELVGYGSYIVNVQADCNGCHTSDPTMEYSVPGNPYLLPPLNGKRKIVNPAAYLAGGSDFGNLAPGSYEILSRNLTPDKTGRPEGGHTYEEFVQIMRKGTDFDHAHPTCAGPVNAGCIPAPFNGALLQIMPWPTFQSMTDHDLRAIYEYLTAIPCIEGPPAPSLLHNDCH